MHSKSPVKQILFGLNFEPAISQLVFLTSSEMSRMSNWFCVLKKAIEKSIHFDAVLSEDPRIFSTSFRKLGRKNENEPSILRNRNR